MAKVTMYPIVRFIQGKVGDVVFKRQGDGVILTRRPICKQPASAAQTAHRERFKQATLYGRLVSADATRKAVYVARAQAQQTPMFSLMIRDFMKAPVVELVDLSQFKGAAGDKIVVLADDDFGVVAVTVMILGENGRLLAEGEAVEKPVGSRRRVYVLKTAVSTSSGQATSTSSGQDTSEPVEVVVRAMDRPGNVGEKRVTVSVLNYSPP